MSDCDRIARERRLRAQVLRGNELAWRIWYDELFGDLLVSVTWLCGGDAHQAEEIVQEAWLTAVRQIRKFDPQQGSFAAWLHGIARNVLRNDIRRTKRANQALESIAADRVRQSGIDRRRETEQITETLFALPPRYEAVLRAKYLDQLPIKLIAAQWNETPKAIESLLTRAREAFRGLYSNIAEDQTSGKAPMSALDNATEP